MMHLGRACQAFFLLFCILLSSNILNRVVPQTIVETLPGFPGTLPFKLETGYVGVGKNEEIQLFYYFIESESNPEKDPLLLWITGGPGCSGFSGLAFEIGPLQFDTKPFDGSFPSLHLNPYSWTKASTFISSLVQILSTRIIYNFVSLVYCDSLITLQIASIIFIDSPVGTGFSYATTTEGYHSSDTKAVKDIYTFLQNWLLNHPKFIKNRLYIAGDSYAGKIIPRVAWEIKKGIQNGFEPRMAFQGYLIGNPVTYVPTDHNSRIPYAHRLALISDAYYELAKSSCDGEYENPDPENYKCLYALQPIHQCINNLFRANILEPECKFAAPKPQADDLKWGPSKILLEDDPPTIIIRLPPEQQEPWCRNYNYVPARFWANDPTVQHALHIRNGTITDWVRCNNSLSYIQETESVVHYHKLFLETECQVLIYSGDHDMDIPYIGTLEWIRSLNLTMDSNWRPWLVNGQIAGYTEKYTHAKAKKYYLTFATVKGGGHTAPEYKPKECLEMLERWLSFYPL